MVQYKAAEYTYAHQVQAKVRALEEAFLLPAVVTGDSAVAVDGANKFLNATSDIKIIIVKNNGDPVTKIFAAPVFLDDLQLVGNGVTATDCSVLATALNALNWKLGAEVANAVVFSDAGIDDGGEANGKLRVSTVARGDEQSITIVAAGTDDTYSFGAQEGVLTLGTINPLWDRELCRVTPMPMPPGLTKYLLTWWEPV